MRGSKISGLPLETLICLETIYSAVGVFSPTLVSCAKRVDDTMVLSGR